MVNFQYKTFSRTLSLNYHDILVKSLGAYNTPELRFFIKFHAQKWAPYIIQDCVIYSANYSIENCMSEKKNTTYRPTFENMGWSTSDIFFNDGPIYDQKNTISTLFIKIRIQMKVLQKVSVIHRGKNALSIL